MNYADSLVKWGHFPNPDSIWDACQAIEDVAKAVEGLKEVDNLSCEFNCQIFTGMANTLRHMSTALSDGYYYDSRSWRSSDEEIDRLGIEGQK